MKLNVMLGSRLIPLREIVLRLVILVFLKEYNVVVIIQRGTHTRVVLIQGNSQDEDRVLFAVFIGDDFFPPLASEVPGDSACLRQGTGQQSGLGRQPGLPGRGPFS